MGGMNYYIFVLGYDLLHEQLNGIECNIAYEICALVYEDFIDSDERHDLKFSEYEALQQFVKTIDIQKYINDVQKYIK